MTDETNEPDDDETNVTQFTGAWVGENPPPEPADPPARPADENVVHLPRRTPDNTEKAEREEMLEEIDKVRELVEKGEIRAVSIVGLPNEGYLDISWLSSGCYDAPGQMMGALSMHAFYFQLQAFQDLAIEDT